MKRKEAKDFIERIIREKKTTPTLVWMKNALEREQIRENKADHNSLKRNIDKINEDGVCNGTSDDHHRPAKKMRVEETVVVNKMRDEALGRNCPIDTNDIDHDRPVKKKITNVDNINAKSNDDCSMKKKRMIEGVKRMNSNCTDHDLSGDAKKLKDDGQSEIKHNDNQYVRQNKVLNRDIAHDGSDVKSIKARDNGNINTNEVEEETSIGIQKKLMKIEEDRQYEQKDMNSCIVSLLIFLNNVRDFNFVGAYTFLQLT